MPSSAALVGAWFARGSTSPPSRSSRPSSPSYLLQRTWARPRGTNPAATDHRIRQRVCDEWTIAKATMHYSGSRPVGVPADDRIYPRGGGLPSGATHCGFASCADRVGCARYRGRWIDSGPVSRYVPFAPRYAARTPWRRCRADGPMACRRWGLRLIAELSDACGNSAVGRRQSPTPSCADWP